MLYHRYWALLINIINSLSLSLYIYIYIYIYIYVCVCVCVCVYVCVYIYIFMCICVCIYLPDIGLAVRVFANRPGESYQRLKKWYLMPPCLTLSIIRYGSRVKWSNPGKGVAPSPTPWCSKLSSFGSPSTMVAYFTFFYLYMCECVCIYIYMCECVCIYIYICVCVCVYIYIYIYICMCVCVCNKSLLLILPCYQFFFTNCLITIHYFLPFCPID